VSSVRVLGLTGPNASGKGTVAEMLKARGFAYHSLSDIVREEAVAAGLTTGRDHLIFTGTRLRREGGAGVLAERIAPRLDGRDVVDSIRNPAEAETLRRLVPGFVLVGVRASAPVRYARAVARGRTGDALGGLEAFLAKEAEENTSDPAAQQLDATFRLADRVVINDGGLGELEAAVEHLLAELGVAP
jgi:dephospho-CoA kinase